jgi:ABC-type multidrug transport system fused ATPase/permease subunit
MTKGASESLSALRTVQAFNAEGQETAKFHDRIQGILSLARKEAIATGIFWGTSGWSGNLTLLGLLAYGDRLRSHSEIIY